MGSPVACSFRDAYVQSGVCGPSRIFYTGRYADEVMAPPGIACRSACTERTIGDFLRPTGWRVALASKIM